MNTTLLLYNNDIDLLKIIVTALNEALLFMYLNKVSIIKFNLTLYRFNQFTLI